MVWYYVFVCKTLVVYYILRHVDLFCNMCTLQNVFCKACGPYILQDYCFIMYDSLRVGMYTEYVYIVDGFDNEGAKLMVI